jgi:hypothetical protein
MTYSIINYRYNGKRVTRLQFLRGAKANGAPMVSNTYRGHDPLISDGIGCMKSQVGEMRDMIRRHGIQGVTVKDSGQLEITSRRGRKDLLRRRGLVDNDASYGD